MTSPFPRACVGTMSSKAAALLPCDAPAINTRPSERGRLARRGAVIAGLAATCWVALGLESIVIPAQRNYRDALWFVPFALTLAAFRYMHRLQRSAGVRLECWGFAVTMASMVLVMIGNIGALTNQAAMAVLAFPLGALLWTAALIIFGLGTWRANVFPRYVAAALVLLEPGSILAGLALSPIAPLHPRGGYSAGVEKGAALALIAVAFYRMTTVRFASSDVSARVRPR
jgi:hypothetical protein